MCFTAPTAYRAMLSAMEEGADLSSLRAAVSAGETLPAPVYEAWIATTGKPMLDGIGATEMLHIFISNRFDDSRPACTGRPVRGYEARIVDDDMHELPRGTVGKLAVRGPDRLPLPRRRPPVGVRARRLEPHRRLVRAGRRRLLPLRGALRRHDHLVGLQHRRPGGGGRAARAPRRVRVRGRSACPTRPAARSCRPTWCSSTGWPPTTRRPLRLQDHVKATIAPFKYPRRSCSRRRCPRPRPASSSASASAPPDEPAV